MLQPDIGNDAQHRYDNVRRIQPSAQARFDHRHLDIALGEVVECHRRGHFEKRQPRFDHLVVIFVDEVHDLLLGDHLAVDPDPFAEIQQMGRRIEPCAVTGLLQDRGEQMRHGAFAVGARHMDREEVALRIAHRLAERGDAFQAGFVGRGAFRFECGQRRKEKIDRLGVIHKERIFRVRGDSCV